MNRRIVIPMTAIGMIGFCASSIARADEVLKFRMFVHGTSIQSQEVGDVDGHVLAVGRFSGQAAFSDGSVGTATLNFTSEYGEHVKGVGTFHTYFSVTPSKDSTLWIKVDGTGRPEGTTTVFPEAPAIVVGGTGKFEGAKGDGKFVGRTFNPDCDRRTTRTVERIRYQCEEITRGTTSQPWRGTASDSSYSCCPRPDWRMNVAT